MAGGFRWSVALQNFIFPPTCSCCGALIARHADLLCADCLARVRMVDPADPLFRLAHARLCDDGLCAGVLALYHFAAGGPVQDLLHALKYGGLTGIGRALGERIGTEAATLPWMTDVDRIIPLPLFRAKQRERGYNQSESIARGISRITCAPVQTRDVRRTRWTDSQTTLGFTDRQINVDGAFEVPRRRSGRLQGKTVLLVDDVVTTGATTRACATALRQGGASAVYVAAVALAER